MRPLTRASCNALGHHPLQQLTQPSAASANSVVRTDIVVAERSLYFACGAADFLRDLREISAVEAFERCVPEETPPTLPKISYERHVIVVYPCVR